MDSVLINTPVSSPLHAQLNLPLLKAQLAAEGFKARVIDSNIDFIHWFLGEDCPRIGKAECDDNPLTLLSYYNDLEKRLWDRSQDWKGLHVALRSLSMRHDRLTCDGVLAALDDSEGNPFIAFYDELIERDLKHSGIGIVGIAITFQDQLIPAFTLAAALRRSMPEVKIVLGGQMVTRCVESMVEHSPLADYFDYLILWDGEIPLVNLHRHLLRGEEVDFTNIVDLASGRRIIDRAGAAVGHDMPNPDFSDLDFSRYLFPEILAPLQTTRSCYAQCAFCAIPFGSNKYGVRDSDRVIADILAIQQQTLSQHGHKATYFKFMEDTSAPSLLYELSEKIESQGIDAKWETFARLEKAFAKPGFMEQLYRGGCRKIHWGLESNDPDILKGMNKKTAMSATDEVLRLSAEAGIFNFCFVLVGFPGETDEMRETLTRYIINNPHIHTLTIATFDLTRKSPMEQAYTDDNPYGIEAVMAKDFQVRLPYLVNGEDWKSVIVPAAHKMMADIVRERPDIGFVTLFPDQIRGMFCDKYGNDWGTKFVARYGQDNIKAMLTNIEDYARAYEAKHEIDPMALPEPLKREHLRTKEDMALLANAILRRRDYENRRIEQV